MFRCSDCSETFQDYFTFTNHLSESHPDRVYCSYCHSGFSHKKNLIRHIVEKHTSPTEYVCSQCNSDFNTDRNLQRHINEQHASSSSFDCSHCDTKLKSDRNLQRHINEQHASSSSFDCPHCDTKLKSDRSLQQHINEQHASSEFTCPECDRQFQSKRTLDLHITDHHSGPSQLTCPKCSSKFISDRVLDRHMKEKHTKPSLHSCKKCNKNFDTKRNFLRHVKEQHGGRKLYPCTDCDQKFRTARQLIQHLREVHRKKDTIYTCPNCDRGFSTATTLERHRVKGCVSSNILSNRNIVVSENNTLSAVLSKRYPALDCTYLNDVSDLSRFEEEKQVSVNVYKIFRGDLFLHRLTENFSVDHTDILYFNENYYLITDFDDLLRSMRLKYHTRGVKFCRRCFAAFYEKDKTADEQLSEHREFCQNDGIIPQVPKNPYLKFKNYGRSKRMRFVIYCDFEALTKPSDIAFGSSSQVVQEHIPFAFGYILKDAESDKTIYRSHSGLDAPNKMMDMLEEDVKMIEKKLYGQRVKQVPKLTKRQKLSFDRATICHICGLGDFDRIKNPKVIDHDHVSGRYLGPAHRNCNFLFRDQTHVDVIVHNLSKYDQNFIFPILGRDPRSITVIPHTMDRYVSFSKKIGKMELRFIDSLKFLGKSLDKLACELPREKFHMCREHTENEQQFDILIKKNVFPYDWLNDMSKLESTTLPQKDDFKSILTGEDITDEQYQFAQMAWDTFGHKTMKDYTITYLLSDVCILGDIFEDFRNMCLEYYNLDACYYLTAPSLAFDAMLYKTRQTIELMTDLNMIGFVSKALRGGLTSVTHRYGRANNKYMGKLYDSSKPSVYHWDIDVNSMYPWAMSQAMPYGGFKWVEPEDVGDIMELADDGPIGYFLEVSLEYPASLHDLHNEMPLCPVVAAPPNAEPDQKYLLESLEDRNDYVLHYRTLKLALKNGLKLKKITKVLQFNQSNWLSSYIEFNSKKRQEAGNNEFKYEFFKLMSNAVYGKFCERVDRRLDIKVATTEKQFLKYVRNPRCIEERMCTEGMVLINMKRKTIVYEKPLYIGAAILEISKLRLYDFHYDIMVKKYGNKAKLHYKDTDSLYYGIHTNDLYEDIKNDPVLFEELDTSSYPADHPLYSDRNRVAMGKFKDEAKADIATEFVGLRTKEYSKRKYIVKEGIERDHAMKSKGIQKAAVKKHFTFEKYLERLHATVDYQVENVAIRARGHKLETIKLQKKALNPNDKKRYILPDGIGTLAWGHYRIKEIEESRPTHE
jgi:DNA-directed RNA polymerase subunit RPC12/RpoP